MLDFESRPKRAKRSTPMLIVCEDSASMFFYLRSKAESLGLLDQMPYPVHVEHDESAPISVVNYALRKSEAYNKEAKKNRSFIYEEVYCVMDVDEHQTLHKAIDKLRTHNRNRSDCEFRLIVSNECAEVWFYLHFDYTTAHLHRPLSKKRRKSGSNRGQSKYRLDKLLEEHLGQAYNKGSIGLYDLLEVRGGDETKAVERAKELERYHDKNGNHNGMYHGNPSTEIYKLIERLNEIGGYTSPEQFVPLAPIVEVIENVFLQRLAELLDKFYASESVEMRKALLQDMLENMNNNTACSEHPEIGEQFYVTCWEENCQQLSYIVHELDIL